MRDLAIRNTHPTVVNIIEGAEAFDANGNIVVIDEVLINDELIILNMDSAVEKIKTDIQKHLDTTAKSFGFETGMDRAGSYAGYTNTYQTDALILVTWRSDVWAYVEVEQANVLAGTRTLPTDMLAELETAFPTPVKGA